MVSGFYRFRERRCASACCLFDKRQVRVEGLPQLLTHRPHPHPPSCFHQARGPQCASKVVVVSYPCNLSLDSPGHEAGDSRSPCPTIPDEYSGQNAANCHRSNPPGKRSTGWPRPVAHSARVRLPIPAGSADPAIDPLFPDVSFEVARLAFLSKNAVSGKARSIRWRFTKSAT